MLNKLKAAFTRKKVVITHYELACQDLEEAKKQLLKEMHHYEYHIARVNTLVKTVKRLSDYIESPSYYKDDTITAAAKVANTRILIDTVTKTINNP
jgi:hypothetical protein